MSKSPLSDQEKAIRAQRADRLVEARKRAGFRGVKSASYANGFNVNSYKAHESGQNGFSDTTAKEYAEAYGVSLNWLWWGEGNPDDQDEAPPSLTDVPLISMVSAGQMGDQATVTSIDGFPTVPAIDLPAGDWVALRVEGDSMNKISPPGSLIFVNRRDKRLVHNACYIVTDEMGNATYKRYRQNEDPPFQPASYDDIPAPTMQGAVSIFGRVRRSVIDM